MLRPRIPESPYPSAPVRTGVASRWKHTVPGYPMTETGQADLLRDLTRWAAASGVSGIRAYGADMVIEGWRPLALFRVEPGSTAAVARPALDSIRQGLARPDAKALGK